jgi:hypothetical protein
MLGYWEWTTWPKWSLGRIFFFFSMGLGFELRISRLQSRLSTTWATLLQVYFALVILEMGILWTICPGWPQIVIFPISASQVARITGISHQQLAFRRTESTRKAGDGVGRRLEVGRWLRRGKTHQEVKNLSQARYPEEGFKVGGGV